MLWILLPHGKGSGTVGFGWEIAMGLGSEVRKGWIGWAWREMTMRRVHVLVDYREVTS
jgi:hypothetical protein